MSQLSSESRSIVLSNCSAQSEEIGGKPIYFSNERDILSLFYMNRESFRHIEGDQERFQQSFGQVQNLVIQCWGRIYAGLQCRVGVFKNPRNLSLSKNKFAEHC
jgi:hypothetical protein